MKILVVDIKLIGQKNEDWKEGFEIYYALLNLGHDCDIAGKNCEISETLIPEIAHKYDLIIISENYHQFSNWKWWNWIEVKTPKLFWAIDTHLVDFTTFIQDQHIHYVAFNNKEDIDKMRVSSKKIWLPYGISKKHYGVNYSDEKIYDVSFIGGLNQDRQKYIERYKMNHKTTFGPDYIEEMQKSKICFNKSISHDLNAKNMEIIGSGTFMLSNLNPNFLDFMDNNENIQKMMYCDDNQLDYKIKYYLENENERETLAKNAREYIFENHSYEKRMEYLLNQL